MVKKNIKVETLSLKCVLGTPMVYPGGKWFDHILVTHRDVIEVDMVSSYFF